MNINYAIFFVFPYFRWPFSLFCCCFSLPSTTVDTAAFVVVWSACTKNRPHQSSRLFLSHVCITNCKLRKRVNRITCVCDTFIRKLIPIKVSATATAVTFQVNIQPSERQYSHFTKQLHQLYITVEKRNIFCESVWRKEYCSVSRKRFIVN